MHTKVRQAAFFKFLSQKVISIVRPFCREALNYQTFTLLQLLPGAVHVGFNAAVDLPSVSEPPVKQPTQLSAKQSVLTTSGKPVSKQPTVARKPAAQKPAMKSTYNASYGRPSSAKSFMRPTSSRNSAKVYLDSVLNKDAKGKPSTSDSREKGKKNSLILVENNK